MNAVADTSALTNTSRPIWRNGLQAAGLGAAAAEFFATGARISGVPMRAGSISATTAQALPPGWVALASVFCTLAGTLLAVVVAHVARHPHRVFVITATVLTVVSFVSPIAAGATSVATKVTLAAAHVIVAAIVIPRLARSLAEGRVAR